MSERRKEHQPVQPFSLRTDQVWATYGLSADFLRRHPEIPRYRAGHRTVLYRRSDIEEFLERRRIA